jgi:hypothetical protein
LFPSTDEQRTSEHGDLDYGKAWFWPNSFVIQYIFHWMTMCYKHE